MSVVPFDDSLEHDTPPARRSVWSRIFERTPRVPTESDFVTAPPKTRRPTEPQVEDDDWDWEIAVARARHATHPGL